MDNEINSLADLLSHSEQRATDTVLEQSELHAG